MAYQEKQLQEISRQFQIYGEILHAETFKIGHINETYSATYDQGGMRVRYIHQKINKSVFKNPPAVMKNVMRVTTHIRRKLEAAGRPRHHPPLAHRHSHPRRPVASTAAAMANSGARSCLSKACKPSNPCNLPQQAFQAGRAFGEFQNLLVDLPGGRLNETIPDFHDTRKRFAALQQAIEKDHYNRAQDAQAEIKFALQHEALVDVILDAMAKGKIPERITHNDTKFNNVMLDTLTGEAKCVVDLDTVMPGCALYDFGDMVRTTTSPTLEDEQDLSKVKMHMPIFKQLARRATSRPPANS